MGLRVYRLIDRRVQSWEILVRAATAVFDVQIVVPGVSLRVKRNDENVLLEMDRRLVVVSPVSSNIWPFRQNSLTLLRDVEHFLVLLGEIPQHFRSFYLSDARMQSWEILLDIEGIDANLEERNARYVVYRVRLESECSQVFVADQTVVLFSSKLWQFGPSKLLDAIEHVLIARGATPYHRVVRGGPVGSKGSGRSGLIDE